MIDYSHTFPLNKVTVFKWHWNEIQKHWNNNRIFYCFGIEWTREHGVFSLVWINNDYKLLKRRDIIFV